MVWDIYGPSLEVINMGRAMVHICLLCGFEMGYSPTYQTHRCLSLSLCCLLLWDDCIIYFVKVHTLSTAFCLGMVLVCPIAVP